MDAQTKPRVVRRTLLIFSACFLAVGAMDAAAAEGQMSETLAIGGAVKKSLTLTAVELEALPGDQATSITLPPRAGGQASVSSVRGVRLTTLLDRAALSEGDHNTWKHTVVIASATDGYKVVFSWPELFNTEVGAGVLVIFERDGKPLDDHEGRIALVSAKDTRAGPRNVHWLNRIEVRILQD
jgi:hypothetical protein